MNFVISAYDNIQHSRRTTKELRSQTDWTESLPRINEASRDEVAPQILKTVRRKTRRRIPRKEIYGMNHTVGKIEAKEWSSHAKTTLATVGTGIVIAECGQCGMETDKAEGNAKILADAWNEKLNRKNTMTDHELLLAAILDGKVKWGGYISTQKCVDLWIGNVAFVTFIGDDGLPILSDACCSTLRRVMNPNAEVKQTFPKGRW